MNNSYEYEFKIHITIFLLGNFNLKANKSVYIAKLRQRYYKTLKNILFHMSNHTLKDVHG